MDVHRWYVDLLLRMCSPRNFANLVPPRLLGSTTNTQPILALRVPLHRLPVLRLPGHDGKRIWPPQFHLWSQLK